MSRGTGLLFALLAILSPAVRAQEEDVTFKSEVSLARVDAQVLDNANRAITGLRASDFLLFENGEPKDISNFANEDMPVDVVLLLDVSGSMRAHVESIAGASRRALEALGPGDRVAIMVFDTDTRLSLPFRGSHNEIVRGLETVLERENFGGGTDIHGGLMDAARYLMKSGRTDARRAIVILTDDQTGRSRDERAVLGQVAEANAVVSALLAPDAVGWRSGPMGGGGGIGSGPLGDIIFGRRGPWGRRSPGPVVLGGSGTRSANTAEIARQSGGDSMSVDQASAFEMTLMRLRQRYALTYHAGDGGGREIEVELSAAVLRRYPDAELRYRRVSHNASGAREPVLVSRTGAGSGRRAPRASEPPPQQPDNEQTPPLRRRPAVNDTHGQAGPMQPEGGWRRTDRSEAAPAAKPEPKAPAAEEQPRQGGWRRIKPGEQP